MCAFSVTFLSATAFCGSSLFVCSFELFRVLSQYIEPCKENITLENNNNNNVLETLLKTV